jgi:hypothetical protein
MNHNLSEYQEKDEYQGLKSTTVNHKEQEKQRYHRDNVTAQIDQVVKALEKMMLSVERGRRIVQG